MIEAHHKYQLALQNEQILEKQAKEALDSDGVLVDVYGNEITQTKTSTKDARTVTLQSSGADGKFGTADDVSKTAVDHNITRAVGKWVGKKSKELAKGLWDGLKEKSEFEEKTDD